MKKVRDARAIINSKKREQQQLQNKIVDARQILKSKQKKNKFSLKTLPEIPTALVKKELGQVLKSVGGLEDKSKGKTMFDKHVEFAKGGILTITSKGLASSKAQRRRSAKLPQDTSTEKLIVNNRKSIMVIKPNEIVQSKSVQPQPMEIDQGDDLENLTLDDFPEIKNLPRGLSSSSLKTATPSPVMQRMPWKPGFSSDTNELQIPVNTMVADTVENTNASLQQQGYTIFVTNLKDFVTQADVYALFSDVGHVVSAQVLQPGTALVVYRTKAEASQACDSYHNRYLDGQPMQCCLLPSNVSTGRSSLSSRLGGKLIPGSSTSPSSPPVSTFRPSTTFQRSHSPASAKSSQRSVQFTVKLP